MALAFGGVSPKLFRYVCKSSDTFGFTAFIQLWRLLVDMGTFTIFFQGETARHLSAGVSAHGVCFAGVCTQPG